MAPIPGLLYVTMQPQESLSDSQWHDWYNNEHGPIRLRLPLIKNGFRYRANDLSSSTPASPSHPEWMAMYDLADIAFMHTAPYLRLRGPEVKTDRERETMAQIKVVRKLFDYISGREIDGYKKVEEVGYDEGNYVVAITAEVNDEFEEDYNKWMEEEYLPMIAKIPGWRRTRRFVTSSILEGKEGKEYLTIHEYAPQNDASGEAYKAALSTEWSKKIISRALKTEIVRRYGLYYTFGAAPRNISNFSSSYSASWNSIDGKTRTGPNTIAEGGVIESYITTQDGVELPYRLEGSADPTAPLIVLSNSILVTYSIWTPFVQAFLASPTGKNYRILRYNTRGRTSNAGSLPISIDLLASDIIHILNTLRVPKAACLIGVSLGGVTVLNTALKYPDRVNAFISCDTNAYAPPSNPKAWEERIAISAAESAKSSNGEQIVGSELAEVTTRRWFVAKNYDNETLRKRFEDVKKQVEENTFEGFQKGVQALYQYDIREEMKKPAVEKGLFLVGSGDGVLPQTMREMAANYGNGVECKVIEGAGHLPMVEKPEEFADIVAKFLG
ncbi:d87e51cb-2696-4179-93d7-b8d73ce5c852-CDS [Sclerotinia trifoliorum]|uniref:D87e51cb-2696-4179-93d7-b8d73ce5c852-CDS n=1 Tax=Sclerotinia trifoliorum TaxID=28548 RepID=A0A8H2VXR1_9HELO|nr:d87e51cb-2696-4179-93d7-b8d73ce5c852-CDS [Sclerotinia trifoliorum]